MNLKYTTKDRTLEISSNPEENIHVLIDGKADKCEITTLPRPSKGGCLRECIAFVKDWSGILVPAVRFVWENFPGLVLIAWSLFG